MNQKQRPVAAAVLVSWGEGEGAPHFTGAIPAPAPHEEMIGHFKTIVTFYKTSRQTESVSQSHSKKRNKSGAGKEFGFSSKRLRRQNILMQGRLGSSLG